MMRWPAAWGWPGAVALLALLSAGGLGGVLAPRWQAQAEAASRVPQHRPAPAPAAASAPRRALPAVGDSAERVAALLRLAARHGLVLERTQQRISLSGNVRRLQVGLTLRGRYVELRSFIAAALRADAGLALDELSLRRGAPEVDQLEAELAWSFFQPASPALAT